jgi:serine/threonine protein phosphatase PrpC
LDALQRREQHFSEQYQKNKPLCFNARAYQKTHPRKAAQGHKDADATLVSPMLVGVADGVSQIEEFGIDASELPNELLDAVEELAVSQLLPDKVTRPQDSYNGPISMMRQAYESTESLGSTTILLAIMDNNSKIHGKIHPMIAILSIGDCEILILRRVDGRLEQVFHTEMQRIGGHAQSPLQLARVDDTVDPSFDESLAIEVIERGSAVHCVSAYEGDIVVLGSDGVFDNLFVEEILTICDEILPNSREGGKFTPTDRNLLGDVAQRIVQESHNKTQKGYCGYIDTPIGRGGKVDDTCCVVGEVVEWTDAHGKAWSHLRRQRQWRNLVSCGGNLECYEDDSDCEVNQRQRHEGTEHSQEGMKTRGIRNYPSNPNASFSTYFGADDSQFGGSFTDIAQKMNSNNDSFSSHDPDKAPAPRDQSGSFSTRRGLLGDAGAHGARSGRRRGEETEESEEEGNECVIL